MSGNDIARDELYPYRFPQMLTEQRRVIGLPLDEVIPVSVIVLWCIWINKPLFGFIIAGIIWFLLRKVKRGKGSRWLYNMMYWYLPTELFRVVFRHIPASNFRQWTK